MRRPTAYPCRHRLRPAALVLPPLMAVLGVLAGMAGAEEREARRDAVTIGVVRTLFRDTPEAHIPVLLRPFRSIMEAQTGVNGNIVVAADAESLGRQLDEEKVQLGVFHGFEFAWARQKYPRLRPLLTVVNQQASLHAFLVVRKDSEVADLAGLRGKAVALPLHSREYCRLFLDRRCPGHGQRPQEFFAQVTRPECIEDALDDVINGDVQGAIVDGISLDWYGRRKPGCHARLKVLLKSEAFPAGVIVYRPGVLDDATVEQFREGMISADRTERGKQLLMLCQISAFTQVSAEYDRSLADIAKAYPPLGDAAESGGAKLARQDGK